MQACLAVLVLSLLASCVLTFEINVAAQKLETEAQSSADFVGPYPYHGSDNKKRLLSKVRDARDTKVSASERNLSDEDEKEAEKLGVYPYHGKFETRRKTKSSKKNHTAATKAKKLVVNSAKTRRDLLGNNTVECKFVSLNATLSCYNGQILCSVTPLLDQLANTYTEFAIGSLDANTTYGYRYPLYPRNSSSDIDYNFGPVPLKSGASASLYFYQSDKLNDLGLKVTDFGCIDSLSQALYKLYASYYEGATDDVVPVLGLISYE